MSMITVLDRLLQQAEINECQEHLIEQAHYAVDNVETKFLARFEELVGEISQSLGQPEFNASFDGSENKNPVPKWVTSLRRGEVSTKVLRLCYWRREGGMSYVVMRIELDSRDRPKYYDLVLGSRKKTRTEPMKMDKLRYEDNSFMGWLKRKLPGKKVEEQKPDSTATKS